MAMFQSSGDGGSTLTTVSRISVPFCPNRMKSRLSEPISTRCVLSPAVGCNILHSCNVNIKKFIFILYTSHTDRYHEIVKEVRQNKGSILKATVDYVVVLKQEQARLRQQMEKSRIMELQHKELLLLLQVSLVQLLSLLSALYQAGGSPAPQL